MTFVRRWWRWALIAFLAVAVVCMLVPLYMRFTMEPYLYLSLTDVPSAQVAIVPGASVYDGEPSPILEARADTAVLLFEEGKVSRILVSGDNATVSYNEVNTVQRYLINAGIPADDIFLDHAGFDTYSSMYRAIKIFDAQSAIIVTQDFHLPRALFIARHLGMQAYGLQTEGGQGTIFDYIREIPASDKALFDLIVHRKPQYLGTQYPLTGSGASTWY